MKYGIEIFVLFLVTMICGLIIGYAAGNSIASCNDSLRDEENKITVCDEYDNACMERINRMSDK